MKTFTALLLLAVCSQFTAAFAQVGGAGGSNKPAVSAPSPVVKKAAPVTPSKAR